MDPLVTTVNNNHNNKTYFRGFNNTPIIKDAAKVTPLSECHYISAQSVRAMGRKLSHRK